MRCFLKNRSPLGKNLVPGFAFLLFTGLHVKQEVHGGNMLFGLPDFIRTAYGKLALHYGRYTEYRASGLRDELEPIAFHDRAEKGRGWLNPNQPLSGQNSFRFSG